MKKAPIFYELTDFLSRSGVKAACLAKESGVHPAYISRLKNGRQQDILSAYADALRAAMLRLSTPTTQPEEEARHDA